MLFFIGSSGEYAIKRCHDMMVITARTQCFSPDNSREHCCCVNGEGYVTSETVRSYFDGYMSEDVVIFC